MTLTIATPSAIEQIVADNNARARFATALQHAIDVAEPVDAVCDEDSIRVTWYRQEMLLGKHAVVVVAESYLSLTGATLQNSVCIERYDESADMTANEALALSGALKAAALELTAGEDALNEKLEAAA